MTLTLISFSFCESIEPYEQKKLMEAISQWQCVKHLWPGDPPEGSRAYHRCLLQFEELADAAALCTKLSAMPQVEKSPGPHTFDYDLSLV